MLRVGPPPFRLKGYWLILENTFVVNVFYLFPFFLLNSWSKYCNYINIYTTSILIY
ncbi:hypothetical protein Hanom_Chr15g01365571 [Helianthus anomalus]